MILTNDRYSVAATAYDSATFTTTSVLTVSSTTGQ